MFLTFQVTTQVVIERKCTARCLQRVSREFVLIVYTIYIIGIISTEPHVASNVRYVTHLGVLRTPSSPLNENELRTHTLHSKVRYFHVTPLALGTKFPLKPGRAATDETVGRSRPKLAS